MQRQKQQQLERLRHAGSMMVTNTVTAHDSITGKGDFGFALQGGSDSGTWNIGGSDNSSSTIKVNATLGSNGSWTTTGTDTGSGGGSWSSGYGGGDYTIDTGYVNSGNWDDETGTVTESGSDNGGYSDSYNYTLGTNGNWQANSCSMTANDTLTDDSTDDKTDNYGVDIGGTEVTGTNIEDDSLRGC